MDRVQKMRQKQREKAFAEKLAHGVQGLPEPAPEQPAATSFPPPGGSDRKPEKAPKQPQAPKQTVKFRCGHEKPLVWFQGGDCGECREQTRKAKAQRRREKLEAAKGPATTPATTPRKAPLHEQGRLPDGAQFAVTYSAQRKEWSGTLTVNEFCSFTGSNTGVEGLLRQLAKECWAWLATKEQG